LLDVLADLVILDEQLGEILLARIPLAEPVGHDGRAKTSRPYFLPHSHPSLGPRHDARCSCSLDDRSRGLVNSGASNPAHPLAGYSSFSSCCSGSISESVT